ncbi:MAG: phosphoribosylamine--glycine ligase [Gemmatimonadales bacterium]|jgi:phosphoribosylamine--glycine ligase
MKILVIGGGGREHTLAWALGKSATVFCAPGNPGTAQLGTNLPVSPSNHAAVVDAVHEHGIDLTVIGPEAPLAAGLVDALADAGYHAFGPTGQAAQIEASKAFAKTIMTEAGVPTAGSHTFTDARQAVDYIESHPEPLVVKASGLAAGKGAIVCESRAAAAQAAKEMFGGRFGDAGRAVLVEEFLDGEELSILALTDGESVMLLPASQDHKRLGEGDTGPNTGGMGAYAPVSIADRGLLERVADEVIRPVLTRMAERGTPYRGVLYAGLMMHHGVTKVLEFNCRFGDPEAQVVLPAIDADLGEHVWRIASGEPWRPTEQFVPATRAAVTTVVATPGYPQAPVKGGEIELPAELPEQTLLFHAGTAVDDAGVLRTAGGRVLCATGLADAVPEAAQRSRALAERIQFDGRVFRRDIAWREVARAGAA